MLKQPGPLSFLRSLVRILAGRPQVPPGLAGNQLLQLLLRRRSVRSFTPDAIPDDVFAAILEAGRLAPSTVNLQTWSFAAFTAESWRDTFGAGLPFGAPRAVIVMADTHRAKTVLDVFPECPLVEYTIGVLNAGLAAMNMNVAAEALGVSSVMLSETGRSGLLDAAYVRDRLALPPGVVPLLTIVFGYPRGPYPPMPPRLPLAQICFEGCYPEPDRAIMEDWLAQMIAGYRAGHPRSSFAAQLRVYQGKLERAEEELRAMVLGEG